MPKTKQMHHAHSHSKYKHLHKHTATECIHKNGKRHKIHEEK